MVWLTKNSTAGKVEFMNSYGNKADLAGTEMGLMTGKY